MDKQQQLDYLLSICREEIDCRISSVTDLQNDIHQAEQIIFACLSKQKAARQDAC